MRFLDNIKHYVKEVMLATTVSLLTANAVHYTYLHLRAPLSQRQDHQTQLTRAHRFSKAADKATTPCIYTPLLSKFRAIAPFVFEEKTTTHPHAEEAAHRLYYQRAMENCIREAGKKPYHLGAGNRESHLNGSRGMLMPLDFASPDFTDPMEEDHVLCLIDSDYYIDMNMLLRFGKPILIYTFCPTRPAGTHGNTSWNIQGGNIVSTTRGAEPYRHPLWEYDGVGELVAHDQQHTIVHRVDSLDIGAQRRLILISPVARIAPVAIRCDIRAESINPLVGEALSCCFDVVVWVLLGIACLSCFWNALPARVLRRRKLEESTAWVDGELAHIVAPGDITSFTTTVNALNSIRLRAAGTSLRISEIQSLLPQMEPSTLYVTTVAQVAPRIHKLVGGASEDVVLTPVAKQVGPLPQAPTKPLTRCLPIPPLAHGAIHLSKGKNEERASILGRVEDMTNDVKPSHDYVKWAAEFAALCAPETGKVRPLDQEEVEALQNRPTQRAKLEMVRNVYGFLRMVVNSFGKAEPATKAGPIRNVSTVPADFRVEYSRFTLPASKHLAATTTWYAFSKTPAEFSRSLHATVSTWDDATENDYTRFDGTNGVIQAVVPRLIMARLYPASFKDQIYKLTLEEVDPPAFTTSGIAYSPGLGTLSGSPSTSFRNSVNNAFVAYATYRRIGKSSEEAYASLGIYGGDDGLDNGSIAEELPKTSAELGLRSKTKLIKNGDPVTFLGRVYPNPWASDCSFSDLTRHLPKLHVTTEMDPAIHPNDILRRKATGFLATDPWTPLLSDWAKYILDNYPSRGTKSNEANWWAKAVKEEGPFPQLPYDACKPHIAYNLNLSVRELLTEIDSVIRTGHLTKPIDLRVPHNVTGDMIVGDVLVEGKKEHNEALEKDPIMSSEKRKERKALVTKTTMAAEESLVPYDKVDEDEVVPDVSQSSGSEPSGIDSELEEALRLSETIEVPKAVVKARFKLNKRDRKVPKAAGPSARPMLPRARARTNPKTTKPPITTNSLNAPKKETRSTVWRAKQAPAPKL